MALPPRLAGHALAVRTNYEGAWSSRYLMRADSTELTPSSEGAGRSSRGANDPPPAVTQLWITADPKELSVSAPRAVDSALNLGSYSELLARKPPHGVAFRVP